MGQNSKINTKTQRLSIGILACIVLGLLIINVNNPTTIAWDTLGYYLYLPETFILKTWQITTSEFELIESTLEQYGLTESLYSLHSIDGTNKFTNKYSIGWSIINAPAFLIAHFLSPALGYPNDGFSLPYHIAIGINGFLFLFLGLVFTFKTLAKFFNLKTTLLSTLIIWLGTNLFFHTAFHGQFAMSHTHLFGLYAFLIYRTVCWYENNTRKNTIIIALVCGLITLIRPSEILCICIPLLWGISFNQGLKSIFYELKVRIQKNWIFIPLFACVSIPQLVYWKISTGNWIFYSYAGNPGEGFDLLSPHTWDYLFSFRKGWIIYSPIILLAFIGLLYMIHSRVKHAFAISIFIVLSIYIASSWSCWWYAESFSQRSAIPWYAVLAFPVSIAIEYLFQKPKRLLWFIPIALLFLFNLFQTWQIHQGILHPSRMTRTYYKKAFLALNKPENAEKFLLSKLNVDPETFPKLLKEKPYKKNLLFSTTKEDIAEINSLEKIPSYYELFEEKYAALTQKTHFWLKIQVVVEYSKEDSEDFLVCEMKHKKAYGWKGHRISSEIQLPDTIEYYYQTPYIRDQEKDPLKIYVWRNGSNNIEYNHIQVWMYQPEFEVK